MMRRTILVLAVSAATLVAMALPSGAILWGAPDGEKHPYVGLIAFYDAEGAYAWRCTGTLLSPTVVLTAGHCTFGVVSARAYFTSTVDVNAYTGNTGGVTGTPHPDPDYYEDPHWPGPLETWAWVEDVGVVILDETVSASTYGQLAPKWTVDGLAAQTGAPAWLELVGYGVQDTVPQTVAMPVRYGAIVWMRGQQSTFNRSYYVQVSSTAKSGGFCFGDSGGPVFLPGTNQILAVNSYVESPRCTGNGWSYRVDTDRGYDFIEPWLG
jgi:hypothetical protein